MPARLDEIGYLPSLALGTFGLLTIALWRRWLRAVDDNLAPLD